MNRLTIKKYDTSYYQIWNQFVAESKNGTFLFDRDFMEYHQDRFVDFSLLVFDDEKLIAILPANLVNDVLYSHQGLTYGSLVYKDLKLAKVIEVFKQILLFLEEKSIRKILIKSIPSIYHKKPAEELLYAMFLVEAQLIRRDTLSVIDLKVGYELSKDRKAGIKRGISNNLIVKETEDFEEFWNEILIPNLNRKHQVNPIHSLKEIQQLKAKFSRNIRQFNVYLDDKIVAGSTIFETDLVAHSQYISGEENKNELGSLDFLHNYFLTEAFKDKKYFDFGVSNENQGKNLNSGLSYWKESFGASIIAHDFYEVNVANHNLLDTILI